MDEPSRFFSAILNGETKAAIMATEAALAEGVDPAVLISRD